jgi:lambda repressor-like predicted transcriptional regulator
MAAKYVLAALVKKRGFTLPELSKACREHEGGQGMGVTQLSYYLTGSRPINDTHFLILCRVLRVAPENVYTSRYLAGGKHQAIVV